jgi:4-diphosphocytidyl-2-C-methyl-D-erythritol kinase
MISAKAYAKINIFLNVTRKREDGYHDIETLFSRVNLYDVLTIEKSQSFNICVNNQDIPAGRDNIIYKVYTLLQEESGNKLQGVNVKLIKNIPSGAGLGGGSSNAATFLNLVDKLFSLNLTLKVKHEILARVGSDTCFFLYDKPMLGTGRGEILRDAPKLPGFYVLLVKPDISISTKEIYQNLKLELTRKREVFRMPHLLSFYDVLKIMNNDLEPVAMDRYTVLNNIKREIESSGSLKAMLSGSGATVYGVYNSANILDNAYLYFRRKYPGFFVHKTSII